MDSSQNIFFDVKMVNKGNRSMSGIPVFNIINRLRENKSGLRTTTEGTTSIIIGNKETKNAHLSATKTNILVFFSKYHNKTKTKGKRLKKNPLCHVM